MSAPLFYEMRNARLTMALRATLDGNYAAKVAERTGTVLSSTEVLVSNQRYELNDLGGAAIGGTLTVQNIGRAGAAVYAPVLGGSTVITNESVYIGSGSPTKPGPAEDNPGSGKYTPDNSTQWLPFVPTTIEGALDILAEKTVGVYNVLSYGAIGDGTTDDTVALTNAHTAATATGGEIYFPSGAYLATTAAFAADTSLRFAAGAMLSIPTGETITINGAVIAGDQQIFTGVGSVRINNATELNAMWFGVSPLTRRPPMMLALRACCAASRPPMPPPSTFIMCRVLPPGRLSNCRRASLQFPRLSI